MTIDIFMCIFCVINHPRHSMVSAIIRQTTLGVTIQTLQMLDWENIQITN